MGISAPPRTIKGRALVDGDKTLGFGALYVGSASYVMAAEVSDELRQAMRRGRYVRDFMRCAREVIALATAPLPIDSIADPEKYGSAKVLKHLGFKHVREDIWRWQTSA